MNTVDRRTLLGSGALALAGAATQTVPANAGKAYLPMAQFLRSGHQR